MQSGDGLADVARLVYVVAGPEEDKRSGSCSLLFVCCAVCYALIFAFICIA